MDRSYQEILNPVGEKADRQKADAAVRRTGGRRPVIGLLNNSKPNVSFFLEAVEKELLSQEKEYQILNVTKPRSAGACPDIDRLAERCDYVINAVAD